MIIDIKDSDKACITHALRVAMGRINSSLMVVFNNCYPDRQNLIPTHDEFDYVDKRAKAKFQNAELVEMRRRFVPASRAEPTDVWWEFKWIVFNRKEGCEK